MVNSSPIPNDFLYRVTAIIEKNMSNEQFGVSELATEMNMSRSNLLRRVKKETKLSVSQLISQVRLKRAMEMLRESSLNVSEVSHRVGFNSTSYFIKCFREYYGYPPGGVGKRGDTETTAIPAEPVKSTIENVTKRRRAFIMTLAGATLVVAIGLFVFYALPITRSVPPEKSIAVLPFKNDSNDSTNVYLINGLMESTLNNLQRMKDLRVISRTSTEKYRNTSKSIPEMARELNVNYFVEGSGQKIGDKILLNIQLIEASTDRHLWAKQYRRETKDIFELQQEIAQNIAAEIQVIITPEEKSRIEKRPTEDPVAYDYFLRGRDLFYSAGRGSYAGSNTLEEAISWFKKAIERDNQFALAYANASMVYYYLDIFQTEIKYGEEISHYADKAMLLDSKLEESLIAKALSYVHKKEMEQAVPYFEKALEYNPNAGLVIHFLTEFYHIHVPNPAKYLEYALRGVRVDIASSDSVTIGYKYLNLSNAFLQSGFLEEADMYIDKSLQYHPENPYSSYVKIFIRFARTRDLKQTKELLIKQLGDDTTRFDMMQEVGKICYMMKDYECAYRYYEKFIEIRDARQLDIFKHENLKIALVLAKMGFKEKSEEFVKSFKQYADNDKSMYRHGHLAAYYCYKGDTKKATEHLRLFAKEDDFQYWVLLLPDDPEVEAIKNQPEFRKIVGDIESRFWNRHKQIRTMLDEKGLLK